MRVASLYLPDFPTARLRPVPSPTGTPPDSAVALASRSVRTGGWRPGARWARTDDGAPGAGAALADAGRPAGAGATPLVLVAQEGARLLVAHACPVARGLGVHAGMALTLARAMVPALEVRDADPEGVLADLTRLALFAVRRWTPLAALSGADGLWLDLTGSAHLHGGEAAFCRRLLRFLARLGFGARIAVAATPGAAHALARYGPDAITLLAAGGEAQALAAFPIAALRLSAAADAGLRRLGVETIADLLAMPRAPLARRFGGSIVTRLDQALGRSAEPLDPVVPWTMPRVTLRFAEPIATAEAIATVITDLIAGLVAELGRRGVGARRLLLLGQRVDGGIARVRVGTAAPSRDPAHLARLLLPKIETIDPGFGLEAMILSAPGCDPLGAVVLPGVLAGARPVPALASLVDIIAGRGHRLYRLGGIESDVPERSVLRVPAIGPAPAPHGGWPRPVRLFDPAEPVTVLAELPDQPPRRFIWRGIAHDIVRGDGPERIYGEWWRNDRAASVRDYYRVEDASGARFWLYRRGDAVDPRSGDLSWHLHGVFG